MSDKNVAIKRPKVEQPKKIPDLKDIENNPEAQKYLLERVGNLPPDQIADEMVKLFEEVREHWKDEGEKMNWRRRIVRGGMKKEGLSDQITKGYIDSKEKEQDFSDMIAETGVVDTMTWLKKEIDKRSSISPQNNSLGGEIPR